MLIDDEFILNEMFSKNRINSNKMKSSWLDKHLDIKTYLTNRYNDSDSIKETLYRIKHNIEHKPLCKTCAKPLPFKSVFHTYCSSYCLHHNKEVIQKTKSTWIKKYGYDNPLKNKEIKEKIKNTNNIRYGGNAPINSKNVKSKIKQTCLKKYGVNNAAKSKEIILKTKATNLQRYGVSNPAKSDKIKNKIYDTLESRYGKRRPMLCEQIKSKYNYKEIIEKGNHTKSINHTFNTSRLEEKSYQVLLDLFSDNDILREYSSEKYPFRCDFYIKSLDLYIECNYHWTHGPHTFNPANDEDNKLLEKWKLKNNKFYNNAINTWTVRDVDKHNTVAKNNLNILEFYTYNDFIGYFSKFSKL